MWLIFTSIFALSFLATGLYRRYALHRLILDVPNNRSSHTQPTPRGGGIAIVVSYVLALLIFQSQLGLDDNHVLAYSVPGLIIATVSFIDDHGHVPAHWRLLVQIIAVSLGLYFLGGVTTLSFLGISIQSSLILNILIAIALVWLINLYNFMDGIDGIASLETIAVCAGLALILWLLAPNQKQYILPLALMAAASGFLCWNFPKAKIFMGDIGSCFLGIEIGLFAIYFSQTNSNLFWSTFILLGAFIVDASVTLMRRMYRGEKIYIAHREHAYQHSAVRYNNHAVVSLAYAAVTVLWLLPLALLVANEYLDGMCAIIIAYIPLVLSAFKLRAGLS